MTEAETQGHSTISLGEILRDLRQEKSLTTQEVGTRLHLDPRIIETLEADDFDRLPASIYVRGYIRNYAKLLEADAEELIRIYEQTGVDEEPEIVPEVRHPSQTSSSDKPVKAFTYLISLVFVILVIAWWQSNFLVKKMETPAGTEQAEGNGHTTVPPAFNYHFDVIHNPTGPYYRTPSEENGGQGAAKPGPLTLPSESTANAPAAEEHQPRVITTDTTGPDSINIELSADSWIEIYDSDDQRVYVGLARAGDKLLLHGTAPFSVLLGFAQGVSIEYNGKPFDIASYSRSGVARFTLGK
ncbi:MAG: DUF4115 domain-containing protein [Gammaproteobacteria bacterium]|jgi:cytoskeleton protein RodZ